MKASTITVLVLAVALGAGCSDGGGSMTPTPDGGLDLSSDGATGGCAPGTQDQDGDGVCNPDCSATDCGHGVCTVASTGTAVCTCDAGFQGDACNALMVPDPTKTAFWVDAADSASLTLDTGAATVSAWKDKGAQALTGTTASTATAPTKVDAALNALPVLHFDGTDDHLTFPGLTGLTNKQYTIFMVVRSVGISSGTVYQGAGTLSDSFESGASPTSVDHYHEPNGMQSSTAADSDKYGAAGWSADAFHLVSFRIRSNDVAVWIDGNNMQAQASAGALKLVETISLTLGARKNGGNAFTGDIAEMIIVADGLHYGQRKPYEDYLAAKWFDSAFARTPSAFGTTAIWLDASQAGNVVVVNGAVTDWKNGGYDQGAFGNGSFPDARPQLVDAALNGKPVVRFDGSDTLGQNGLAMRPGGEQGQYTIFAVVRPPTQATFTGHLVFRANKVSNDAMALELFLTPNMLPEGQTVFHHRWPTTGVVLESTNVAEDFTKPLLIKVERSNTANYHMIAGTKSAMSTGDIASNIPDGDQFNWLLGGASASAPGSNALNGDIAEFIVMTSAVENAEESALLDMLRAKWGL